MKNSYEENQFSISLNGIDLSEKQRQRIDQGVKEVVMRELAAIDHQGDYIINNNIGRSPFIDKYKLPPHTMGIWIERFDRYRDRLVKRFK